MELKVSEKYSHEDERQMERIAAKNNLRAYAFNIKSRVEEVMEKVNETIVWLDNNQFADSEEFEDRQQQLNDLYNHTIK